MQNNLLNNNLLDTGFIFSAIMDKTGIDLKYLRKVDKDKISKNFTTSAVSIEDNIYIIIKIGCKLGLLDLNTLETSQIEDMYFSRYLDLLEKRFKDIIFLEVGC